MHGSLADVIDFMLALGCMWMEPTLPERSGLLYTTLQQIYAGNEATFIPLARMSASAGASPHESSMQRSAEETGEKIEAQTRIHRATIHTQMLTGGQPLTLPVPHHHAQPPRCCCRPAPQLGPAAGAAQTCPIPPCLLSKHAGVPSNTVHRARPRT